MKLTPKRFSLVPKRFSLVLKNAPKSFCHFTKTFKTDENGNVESAMVLIPLLILFLISLELIIATNLRNSDYAMAQADASNRAITGEITSSDQVIELNSLDPFSHIKLLITSRRRTLPQLIPGLIDLLSGNSMIQVNGAAVIEEIN